MMRHQRRTIQGPVSDVALRGRSEGHLSRHSNARFARECQSFLQEFRQYEAGRAQILNAAGILLLAFGVGAVAM